MKYTIRDFKKDFPDDEACLAYIFQNRYGSSYACPKCAKVSWHKVSGRKVWACAWCGQQVHPLASTIFHKSDTPLSLWFFAIYKFANSRNGVSAKELERDLGVTYKTAWRMAKQIRSLFDTDGYRLGGNGTIVEVDEAFMSKIQDQAHRRGTPKAIGLVERGGAAKAVAVDNVRKLNTIPLINHEVEKGSQIFTDRAALYRAKNLEGYGHEAVNHSAGEYSFGGVHINNVEALFSQIKRSIDGTYHRISRKYLQAYLDEFAWKLTHGRNGQALFPLLLQELCQPRALEV